MKTLLIILMAAISAASFSQTTVSTTKIGDKTTLVMWSGWQGNQLSMGSFTVFEWPLPMIMQQNFGQVYIPTATTATQTKPPEKRINFFYIDGPLMINVKDSYHKSTKNF